MTENYKSMYKCHTVFPSLILNIACCYTLNTCNPLGSPLNHNREIHISAQVIFLVISMHNGAILSCSTKKENIWTNAWLRQIFCYKVSRFNLRFDFHISSANSLGLDQMKSSFHEHKPQSQTLPSQHSTVAINTLSYKRVRVLPLRNAITFE